MFSALAEFERSLIRERTRAGLAAARRIGRTGGATEEAYRGRSRGGARIAGQPRYRRDPDRAPPWRVSRHALPLHSQRADGERP
jgi:DNA invertase Pin-like site-specific DNA recombinase